MKTVIVTVIGIRNSNQDKAIKSKEIYVSFIVTFVIDARSAKCSKQAERCSGKFFRLGKILV